MTDSTLQFRETYSIDRFKSMNNVKELRIIKNPHTSKLFFTCPDDSTISGKVGKEGWQDDPVISLCVDTSTGETFHMLHKKGSDSSENVVATL